MGKSFRNSFTSGAGNDPAEIVEGRVINVNIKNFTVDVVSKFDQLKYLDIQLLAPYLHHINGEGLYAMPEIGATCKVCIGSDTTSPFVLGFLAPLETTSPGASTKGSADNAVVTQEDGTEAVDPDEVEDSEAPEGTRSRGADVPSPSDASFAAGRPAMQPGDIVMRTRDENFLILHRGGVLQIGATELSQRIYIPIGNIIQDISQDYHHHNTGGLIRWNMMDLTNKSYKGKQPTRHMEVFRIFADDKYADIRIIKGHSFGASKVEGPLEDEVVFDFEITPGGFDSKDGSRLKGTTYNMRVAADLKGNVYFKAEGDVDMHVDGDFSLTSKESISLLAEGPEGGITLRSLLRDIEVSALVGDIELNTLVGAIKLQTLRGVDIVGQLITLKKTSDAVPVEPLPMGLQLIAWLASHTHAGPSLPASEGGLLPGILSTTVVISK